MELQGVLRDSDRLIWLFRDSGTGWRFAITPIAAGPSMPRVSRTAPRFTELRELLGCTLLRGTHVR